jgi:tRNA(His) 5'-end guanylyltransferase
MNDALGSRMKERYEDRSQTSLPRRTWSIIRLDGRAFHTYTRGCTRPYDLKLMQDMDDLAIFLCKEIQGARFAYVQSDEISILVADMDKTTTEMWFNGNIQKICSISSSLATAFFNSIRFGKVSDELAIFDSRVFSVPDPVEVANYFVWRQKDAERNSLQMLARSYYSHEELNAKGSSDLHDLIHEKSDNWSKYPARCKRGGFIMYKTREATKEIAGKMQTYTAGQWEAVEVPVFVSEPNFLKNLIPSHGY